MEYQDYMTKVQPLVDRMINTLRDNIGMSILVVIDDGEGTVAVSKHISPKGSTDLDLAAAVASAHGDTPEEHLHSAIDKLEEVFYR